MITPTASDVLIIVDAQNDFCPGGALAVPGGALAVPGGDESVLAATRLARHFRHIVLTQDWHPAGHRSFASAHPGKKPFDTVTTPYGAQALWPDHCVQGSPGAQFHPALDVPRAELIIRKGCDPMVDSYSAFYENDRKTPTGLEGYLRARGFKRIFLAGLATDFCVLYTALDARRSGFDAVVVEDACRAIDLQGSLSAAKTAMAAAGVTMARMADFGGTGDA